MPRYTIHEARAFDEHAEGEADRYHQQVIRAYRPTKGIEIRRFSRSVRAGKAEIGLTVIVVRSLAPKPDVAPLIGTARA